MYSGYTLSWCLLLVARAVAPWAVGGTLTLWAALWAAARIARVQRPVPSVSG
jgi:hypothetical protein